MAGIETLTGVTKVDNYLYEVTGGLVSVGAGIDDIEYSTFIQKDGGLLNFDNGCTTTFTRCEFVETITAYTTTLVRLQRFLSGTAPVFEGCSFKFDDLRLTITGDVTSGSNVITNVSDVSQLYVGHNLRGSGLNNNTLIESIDTLNNEITISHTPTTSTTSLSIEVRRQNIDFDVYSNSTPQFNSDNRGAPCVLHRDANSYPIANHFYFGTFNNFYVDQRSGGGAFELQRPTAVINGLYMEDRGLTNPLGSRHFVIAGGQSDFHNNTTTLRNVRADNIAIFSGSTADNDFNIRIVDTLGDLERAEDNANSQRGNISAFRTYKSNPIDPSTLNPVSVKCYLQNTDNSDIILNSTVTSVDEELLQYSYNHNSTAIIEYKANGAQIVENNYKLGFIAYDRNIFYSEFAITERLDGSSYEYSPLMINDDFITESNSATVAAYTTIDTSYQVYDRAKLYLVDNYQGESSLILTRDGAQVNTNSQPVIIDSTFVNAFRLDLGNVEIKSSTFSGGIVSTGGVTIAGDTAIDGGTFDADMSYETTSTIIRNVNINGTLDFTQAGNYTIENSNITEVTNSSGGIVSLSIDSNSLISTITGPDITTSDVAVTIAHNAVGGSFTYLNTGKWNAFKGVYADHASGQAAVTSPVNGDYYFVEPLLDGNRTDAAYYQNSVWYIHGSPDIHEGYIASTYIGGPGLPANHVINVPAGTNIRICIDNFGYHMKLTDIVASNNSFPIVLELNENVLASRISDALPYTTQFDITGPDTNGVITLKTPSFDANPGDSSDPDLAACAAELARLGESSLASATANNRADSVEITNVGELTVKNDIIQIVPLDSVVAGEKTIVPLFLNVVNYTIDPLPVAAANTYVSFDNVQKSILPSAAITGLAEEVWDVELQKHSNPQLMGGQLVRQAYNGWLGEGVHMCNTVGEIGQTPGVNGTANNPCISLIDAKVLAEFFGFSVIYIHRIMVADTDLGHYTYAKYSADGEVNLNGYGLNDTNFQKLDITGSSSGGSGVFCDCRLFDIDGYSATVIDGSIAGDCVIPDGGMIALRGSGFENEANVTHGAGTVLWGDKVSGDITVKNSTATCFTSLAWTNGSIIIDASNTDAYVFNVSRLFDSNITNNSALEIDKSNTYTSEADIALLSTFDHSVDEVITNTASREASKADISGLSTFDPTVDEVITNTASREASKAAIDLSGLSTFDPTVDEVITNTASREASKADVSGLSTFDYTVDEVITDATSDVSKADLQVINDGVKKASLFIPHTTDLT